MNVVRTGILAASALAAGGGTALGMNALMRGREEREAQAATRANTEFTAASAQWDAFDGAMDREFGESWKVDGPADRARYGALIASTPPPPWVKLEFGADAEGAGRVTAKADSSFYTDRLFADNTGKGTGFTIMGIPLFVGTGAAMGVAAAASTSLPKAGLMAAGAGALLALSGVTTAQLIGGIGKGSGNEHIYGAGDKLVAQINAEHS